MERRLFNELTKSVRQAGATACGEKQPSRGCAFPASRFQAVREKTELSQALFARPLNVSVKTLQNWERDRRVPTVAAKALLILLAHGFALGVCPGIAAEASRGGRGATRQAKGIPLDRAMRSGAPEAAAVGWDSEPARLTGCRRLVFAAAARRRIMQSEGH
jgi:putative transcriptional regulator